MHAFGASPEHLPISLGSDFVKFFPSRLLIAKRFSSLKLGNAEVNGGKHLVEAWEEVLVTSW